MDDGTENTGGEADAGLGSKQDGRSTDGSGEPVRPELLLQHLSTMPPGEPIVGFRLGELSPGDLRDLEVADEGVGFNELVAGREP